MKFIIVFLTLLVSACFKAEPPVEGTGKQSAIEVKSQTQTINLAPLSNNTLNANKPNLRGAAKLFALKISDVQVEDAGVVVKLLVDDNKGARHQKFLVKINRDQTLLFAHNVDLAPRLTDLKVGDAVQFRGEYVYNLKGGIVHWTHLDPQGKHFGGWIKHNGKLYE
jgi:hypothetical protein